MRLLNLTAYKIAKSIVDRFYWSNKTKRIYYYVLRCIFGTIFKMAVIFSIAALLDVFKPTLYCAITYGIVKVLSGGMHHRPLGRSILLSVMLFITMGVISDTFYYIYKPFDDVLTKGPYIYVWLFFIISLLITIFFVPVRVRHKVSDRKWYKYTYKMLTLIFIVAAMYYTLQILKVPEPEQLIDVEMPKALAIWTGIVFELFVSIPVVYFATSKLNQILNYK